HYSERLFAWLHTFLARDVICTSLIRENRLLQRLLGARTQIIQRALRALWLPRDADRAAMGDEAVGEVGPFLFWDKRHQVLLDFFGVGVCGQAEAAGGAG